MDKAALLRIKFTPLLSKISTENINSRCCIEIVPELSGIQNLDKIDWKSDNELVEYEIPMTYKITIKKQTFGLENKVYHSCVDLLPAYSTSNHDMDLASGDVKRVKSDNMFVLNLNSCSEKCVLVPTKNLLSSEEKPKETITESWKTTSIQTLEILSNPRIPGVDKCLEVNKSLTSNIRAVRSEETLKGDIDKFNIGINTNDSTQKIGLEPVKLKTSGSLDDIYNTLVESHRKLSLSPICSVNTWDKLPPGPTYITKNTTSNYILSESMNKGVTCNIEHPFNTNNPNKENNNTRYIPPIYETRTYVTLKFDDVKRTENKPVDKIDKFVDVSNEPTFANHAVDAVNDLKTSTSHNRKSNFVKSHCSHGFNNNYKSYDYKNTFEYGNLYKTIDLSSNKKLTSYLNKKQSNLYTTKKGSALKIDGNNILISTIDSLRRPNRASPEARVASLLKNIEAEIYPLKKRLHDIKCKCAVLGLDLFCGEFTPCPRKSIMYQPVPNFDYLVEESSEQQNNEGKSNRVVYSILFNG